MKNTLFCSFLFFTFLFLDVVAFAQPGTDDGAGGLEGDDAPAAPINSKLIWLAIVGISFAYYAFKKKQKSPIG